MTRRREIAAPESETPAQPVADNGVALYGRWFPAKIEGLAGIKTTLDTSTEEGKALVVAAGSPGDLDLDAQGELRMVIHNFAAFWDTEADEETGEISEFTRSVFYNAAGQTFRTTSAHAPHFFARCVDLYGWERIRDEGLPITIRRRRGKRGFDYHDFRVNPRE